MEFTFMDTITNSLQTDVARFILACFIAATGCLLAFGETQGMMKKVILGCFGGSLLVGAGTVVSALWGV